MDPPDGVPNIAQHLTKRDRGIAWTRGQHTQTGKWPSANTIAAHLGVHPSEGYRIQKKAKAEEEKAS